MANPPKRGATPCRQSPHFPWSGTPEIRNLSQVCRNVRSRPVRHSMFPLAFLVAVQTGAPQPVAPTFLPLSDLNPNCVYIARYRLYADQDITNAPKHHCVLESVDSLFEMVAIILITTCGDRTSEQYWSERAILTQNLNGVYHQFEYHPFGSIGTKGAAIIECRPLTVKGSIHFRQRVFYDYSPAIAAHKLNTQYL